MARFANKSMKKTPAQKLVSRSDVKVNRAGGLAFSVSPEMELYLRCTASFLQDSYYQNAAQELKDLRTAISKCDREFVLKLANYSRNAMNLRTIPMVMLAEASRMQSKAKEAKADVRAYVPRIVRRGDEPMELVAYYVSAYGSKAKFPNALKKGIADAIRRMVRIDGDTMDVYALSKYWRGSSTKGAVTPKDVLRICHLGKKADPILGQIADLVFNDKLPVAETWETEISGKGSTKEQWEAIAPNMGIMALLRNCRNFEQKGAEKAIQHAISVFTNAEHVRNSRLLPFRWYTAVNQVNDSRLADAIREGLELSVANIPKMSGSTAIFADNSGSMRQPVSGKSEMHCIDVAAVMAALGLHMVDPKEKAIVGAFGDTTGVVNCSRKDSVLTNADKVKNKNVGWSTNAWTAIEYLIQNKISVDRVMLFSDMQCYSTSASRSSYNYGSYDAQLAPKWHEYLQKVNRKSVLYSVNLAAYGDSQFPEDDKNVVLLSGWSDRIFDLMTAFEDRESVIEKIKKDW